MIVDSSAAARKPDGSRVELWLSTQRVFISSAMNDTAEERRKVARVVEDNGAQPVWFEELGRDASAQEAYLAGVDSSTIYLGILNEIYGRIDETGFSATETEYNRARATGKRTGVFVAADAPSREGHLRNFLERIRVFITTEDYSDPDDLGDRAQRRLHELAAEALSPWVKLNDLVFRADEIVDRGSDLLIRANASDEIVRHIEALRDQPYGRSRVRFTYGDRVVDANVAEVERTVRAGGTAELSVSLTGAARVQEGAFGRVGTSGASPDDLVELGLRSLFLGDSVREDLMMMGLTKTRVNEEDLAQAFHLPNEIVGQITRLVLVEGLVGGGHAERFIAVRVGPRDGGKRSLEVQWEPPAEYGGSVEVRELKGDWQPTDAPG